MTRRETRLVLALAESRRRLKSALLLNHGLSEQLAVANEKTSLLELAGRADARRLADSPNMELAEIARQMQTLWRVAGGLSKGFSKLAERSYRKRKC